MRKSTMTAAVVVAVLATGACGDDQPTVEDVDRPTATVTVTATETVTATPTVEPPTPDALATGGFVTVEQDLILAPQEPVQVETGERRGFSVPGDDLPDALDVALLPCENVSFEGAGMRLLVRDGVAVGLGETDTGSARIVAVNGDDIEPATSISDVSTTNEPGSADPAVAFEVRAEQPDCAVPLVFDDADDDDEFDVREERASGAKVTIVG